MNFDSDLKTIASLEFGKAMHRLSEEKEERLRTVLAGLQRGGPQVAAKREIELKYAEKSCTALAEIWVGLLEGTNGGILTREHVDFIKSQVQGAAAARRGALSSGPPAAPIQSEVAGYVARQMEKIVANVGRDLELRFRRQEAGLRKEPMKELHDKSARTEDLSLSTADRRFARLAVDESRKSVSEQDGRPRPKVGAVVVKEGQVLSVAHRGEPPYAANHAEYIALEKKLPDLILAGSTVYTTLEPCTTRNTPKIPCADRLIERRVARVVIGMLDPDPRIRGRGILRLRDAGIAVELFPEDLMTEIEELNRDFSRECQSNFVRTDEFKQTPDVWLAMFKEKQQLEEEIASLEAQVPSVYVRPTLSLGKDSLDLLKEKIERKKRQFEEITTRMRSQK